MNPGSSGGSSNALTFTVQNPIPAPTALSPNGAVKGDVGLTVTVTGMGFVSTSKVEWNGTALATTYVSSTNLTAAIPTADLAEDEMAQVAVSNPSPGGGVSPALYFGVVSGPTRVLVVNQQANDIAWDAAQSGLIASLPGTNGGTGSLVTVNPETGAVGTPVAAGHGTNLLSVSADDSHVWVGEDADYAIGRFTLPGLSPDLTVPLPQVGNNKQAALSIRSAPASAGAVAVLLYTPPGQAVDYSSSGVVVFDNGVQRPNATLDDSGLMGDVAWSPDESRIYASGEPSGGAALTTYDVGPSGLTTDSVQAGPPAGGRITYDATSGNLYYDSGEVVKPSPLNFTGNFNLNQVQGGSAAIDSGQGIVFFAAQGTWEYLYGDPGVTLLAFDKGTGRLLDMLWVPQVSGKVLRLVRWGKAGLAFVTQDPTRGGAICIVDGEFVNANATPDFSAGPGVGPLPEPKALNPESTSAGAGDTTVTISGAGFMTTSIAYLNPAVFGASCCGVKLATQYVSDGELQVTIPAAMLATAGTGYIAVTNGGLFDEGGYPYPLSKNDLAFTVIPAGESLTALNISMLDVAWDPKSGLLYGGAGSADLRYGNSILAIDPMKGSVVASQAIGADPYKVRTTADGAYLYSGYMLEGDVTRLDLPGLNNPLSWQLGAGTQGPLEAVDIQADPANSQTTAVAEGYVSPEVQNWYSTINEQAAGSLTIFDGGVARANTVPANDFFNAFLTLQWGSGSMLYAGGSNNFYGMSVDATGLTQNFENSQLLVNPTPTEVMGKGWYPAIHLDSGTGYLYDDNGLVIDPVKRAQVGSYSSSGLAAPDSSLNKVFFLGQTNAQNLTPNFTIVSYDQKNMTMVGSTTISGLVGVPLKMVRWGVSGLAIVTQASPSVMAPTAPGMLYLINDPKFVSANSTPGNGASDLEPVHRTWGRAAIGRGSDNRSTLQ